MPHLNKTGPEGEGPGTGRKLGKCSDAPSEEKLQNLGRGMGARRKSDSGEGQGKGRRLKSGKQ
jgi:hypothetical protein